MNQTEQKGLNVSGDGNMTAGGNIEKSKNKPVIISKKQIRKETVIISFIVGFLSSLLASVIFYIFFT